MKALLRDHLRVARGPPSQPRHLCRWLPLHNLLLGMCSLTPILRVGNVVINMQATPVGMEIMGCVTVISHSNGETHQLANTLPDVDSIDLSQ